MTKLLISSDLHLGHRNILKFRKGFSSQYEHDETLFENLATSVGKRDSLYLLGDVAFTPEWVTRLATIKCAKKTLILGNHDTDRSVSIQLLGSVFASIHSLQSRNGVWFSHCPIHPAELRGRKMNIHGHVHAESLNDTRYFNACVDVNGFKPVAFTEIEEWFRG